MQPLHTRIEGTKRYRVVPDLDIITNDIPEDYIEGLKQGEYEIVGIVSDEKCTCCDGWNTKDSLWGILIEAGWYEQAISDYQSDYEV